MKKSVSIRLPRGMYLAVRELADKFSMDQSATATMLLIMGLRQIRPEKLSEDVRNMIAADLMEAVAALIRALHSMPKQERESAQKYLDGLQARIVDFIGKEVKA